MFAWQLQTLVLVREFWGFGAAIPDELWLPEHRCRRVALMTALSVRMFALFVSPLFVFSAAHEGEAGLSSDKWRVTLVSPFLLGLERVLWFLAALCKQRKRGGRPLMRAWLRSAPGLASAVGALASALAMTMVVVQVCSWLPQLAFQAQQPRFFSSVPRQADLMVKGKQTFDCLWLLLPLTPLACVLACEAVWELTTVR